MFWESTDSIANRKERKTSEKSFEKEQEHNKGVVGKTITEELSKTGGVSCITSSSEDN